MTVDYDAFFTSKWEQAKEKIIVNDDLENYLGFIQVMEIEGLADSIVFDWTTKFKIERLKESRNPLNQLEVEFFGSYTALKDKHIRTRFVTIREYEELFDKRIGQSLDRLVERTYREEKTGRNNDSFFGRIMAVDRRNEEIKKLYNEFYFNHKSYGLFGIKSEEQRQDIANLLSSKDNGYYETMATVNKTLFDFFF